MALATDVGAEVAQLVLGGRAIPDVVPVASRHEIAQHHLARRQHEVVAVAERLPQPVGQLAVLDEAAPRDVAGIPRLGIRDELRAYARAQAVGADQEIGACLRAVVETRDDFGALLREAAEIAPSMVMPGANAFFQRAINACPVRHDLVDALRVHGVAVAIEADALGHADAEPVVDLDAEPAQRIEQRAVRADSRAARRELVGDALVDVDLPAELLQEAGGEQAAERAADDDGAAAHQSTGWIWFSRTTSLQRAISLLKSVSAPCPVRSPAGYGVTPVSAQLFISAASSSTPCTTALSLSITGFGVAAGANSACQ